ncbi:pectinesterase [Synchytrium microbalum]|uniref:pectinesterase n=1 Tax=Synchytrium microbalum TaxID=1806994 RepID=A0A507C3U8_9FUNG|nr:pectinesterase [Synchytrium microbalum]TPX36210.1 pectinesterase [Synchytrium microbalum]
MFKTIQAAVNNLSTTAPETQILMIAPGKYIEQVTIPDRQAQLTIYGLKNPSTSYADNQVTISFNKNRATETNNYDTATLRMKASKVKMYNVNVENTSAPSTHQALAVAAFVGMQGYYGCQFSAYQDTVWTNEGHQVYAKCMISGQVDFIFGEAIFVEGRALVTKSDVRVVPGHLGFITASGRASSTSQAWLVLDQCNIGGGDANTTGKIFLGRPWGDFAKTTVQNSVLSNIINPDGWAPWSPTMPHTANATFVEFGNTGPGAAGNRTIGKHAGSVVTIADVLGTDYMTMPYVDAKFL